MNKEWTMLRTMPVSATENSSDLPDFRFPLERMEAKTVGGNTVRESTVAELPIATGIAGVSMRLEPGGLRELHWHSTAAEWGYVVEGRCRTTILSPDGSAETNDFDPGDVWYFPKGHPHSIQGLGPGICHFILMFDNGAFAEFGAFSVSDWVAHSAAGLLTKNLGVDAKAQAALPRDELYFARGPVPPTEQAEYLGHFPRPAKSHKFKMMSQEPHFVGRGGTEWVVDQNSFPIASTISSVKLDLAPGGLRELHWHPSADEWQYILKGRVRMTMFGAQGRHRTETFEAGDTGYIPAGYGHSIENVSDTEPAEILIGFNTGQYEGINLSTWLAANPSYLLECNLGLSAEVVQKLPRRQQFVIPKDGPEPRCSDGMSASPRWTFDGAIHNNSLAISPDETIAVASYSERPDIIVYDLKSSRLRDVMHGYITPRNILFDRSGAAFYVSDSSLGQIKKIESSSLTTLESLQAGPGAFGTAISSDSKTLYVNNQAASTVTRFDLDSGRPIAVVTGFAQPRQGVRLGPDGKMLFVTNFLGDKISLVNTETNKIEGEIGGFNRIRAISITRDGKTLFAANSGADAICVVDLATRKITATIAVGKDPYGAALSPDERLLYSGNLGDNSLTVIALPSRTVTATITGFRQPRQAIVFSRDGKTAFVLNEDLSISRVDVAGNRIVEVIRAQ
jgi:oxalate decarboxylase